MIFILKLAPWDATKAIQNCLMATSQFNDALHFFSLNNAMSVRLNSYPVYKNNHIHKYSLDQTNRSKDFTTDCMDVESAPASACEAKEAECAPMQMDTEHAMELDMDCVVFVPTKRQRVQSSMAHGQPARLRCRVR